MINLNRFVFYALSGALVGALIGGVWARIAMRIVALLLGGTGSFTLEGSIGILILAALLGLPFGQFFGAVKSRLPGAGWVKGLLAGVPWMLLFASFFVINREGELGLLPAWQGALLFAPLCLAQGFVLGTLDHKMSATLDRRPRRMVSGSWFVLFLLCFVLAFLGMTSLMGNSIRLPKAVADWSGLANSDFPSVYGTHRVYGLFFALFYLGLTTAAFVLSSDSIFHRLAVLATLLFAAGWFNIEGMAAALFERNGWVDALSWALRLIGGVALCMLLTKTVQSSKRSLDPLPPHRVRPVLWGLGVALGCFVGLWIGTLFVPSLAFRSGGIFAPLAVTVYLLPWLALPTGLLMASLQKS